MADIYRSAQRVIVWLGEADEDTAKALDTLKHIGSQTEYTRDSYQMRAPNATEMDWWQLECPLPYGMNVWLALNALFHRPWFERVWILQEIQLANSQSVVRCGSAEVSWPLFRRAILCLQGKKQIPYPPLGARLVMLRNLADYAVGLSLGQLVRRHHERKCSDARDKVYGVLSILPPRLAALIDPTYGAKPVWEVYRDALLSHYQVTHRLELFEGCRLERRPDAANWPSWVPDWFDAPTGWPFRLIYASGASRGYAEFIDPRTLRVSGVQCDTVTSVSATIPEHGDDLVVDSLRTWASPTNSTDPYVSGGTTLQALATVLCGYRLRERYPRMVSHPTLNEWCDTMLTTVLKREGLSDAEEEVLKKSRQMQDALAFVKGRTLITTGKGQIGLGLTGTRPGDTLCVLLGTNTNVILRPNGPGRYSLVGECSVHGTQDSLTLLGLLGDWRVQIRWDANGLPIHSFFNSVTGEAVDDDPRLGELPAEWERVSFERMPDDPIVVDRFRRRTDGHLVNYDPRLSPQRLGARGVRVRSFDIV